MEAKEVKVISIKEVNDYAKIGIVADAINISEEAWEEVINCRRPLDTSHYTETVLLLRLIKALASQADETASEMTFNFYKWKSEMVVNPVVIGKSQFSKLEGWKKEAWPCTVKVYEDVKENGTKLRCMYIAKGVEDVSTNSESDSVEGRKEVGSGDRKHKRDSKNSGRSKHRAQAKNGKTKGRSATLPNMPIKHKARKKSKKAGK